MFLLNSWLNQFTETHLSGYALSRSYSVNLPSSFSTAHPSALEYSSRLPVSVCGTSCYTRFSWDRFYSFASPEGSAQRTFPSVRKNHVDPSLLLYSRYRNINLFSISYAFRPRLRDRLTLGRLTLPRKPWAYGERVSHPFYRYLCQHYHFPLVQRTLQSAFIPSGNAPLPPIVKIGPRLRYHA